MKICLACTPGGHTGEMLRLMEAFHGHEIFFLSWESTMSSSLPYPGHLLKNPIKKPVFPLLWAMLWGLLSSPSMLRILLTEKPDLVVSSGSGDVAVPTFYMAKLLGMKTIWIEPWTTTKSSLGGRLVYPASDVFFVQRAGALNYYGKKARYEGVSA